MTKQCAYMWIFIHLSKQYYVRDYAQQHTTVSNKRKEIVLEDITSSPVLLKAFFILHHTCFFDNVITFLSLRSER